MRKVERFEWLNLWFGWSFHGLTCEEYFQLGSMIWDTSVGGLVFVSWWCGRDQVDLYWPRRDIEQWFGVIPNWIHLLLRGVRDIHFRLYIWSSDQFWLWNWELILKKWMIQHFQIVVELPTKVNVLTIEWGWERAEFFLCRGALLICASVGSAYDLALNTWKTTVISETSEILWDGGTVVHTKVQWGLPLWRSVTFLKWFNFERGVFWVVHMWEVDLWVKLTWSSRCLPWKRS